MNHFVQKKGFMTLTEKHLTVFLKETEFEYQDASE